MRVFALFPRSQKSAQSVGSPSPRVPGSSSSWTPAAHEEPTPPLEGFFIDASGARVDSHGLRPLEVAQDTFQDEPG